MSNLDAPAGHSTEHQMMEEGGVAGDTGQGLVTSGAAALELNQAMTASD